MSNVNRKMPEAWAFDPEIGPFIRQLLDQVSRNSEVIGTINLLHPDEDIPPGWQECDGTNGTLDLTPHETAIYIQRMV
jgi:hypothetical protein